MHSLKIKKVPGERNPADLGTKGHPVQRYKMLREMCGIVDCSEIDGVPTATVAAVEQCGPSKQQSSGRQTNVQGASRSANLLKLLVSLSAVGKTAG